MNIDVVRKAPAVSSGVVAGQRRGRCFDPQREVCRFSTSWFFENKNHQKFSHFVNRFSSRHRVWSFSEPFQIGLSHEILLRMKSTHHEVRRGSRERGDIATGGRPVQRSLHAGGRSTPCYHISVQCFFIDLKIVFSHKNHQKALFRRAGVDSPATSTEWCSHRVGYPG